MYESLTIDYEKLFDELLNAASTLLKINGHEFMNVQ